jgi:hypothetical protein
VTSSDPLTLHALDLESGVLVLKVSDESREFGLSLSPSTVYTDIASSIEITVPPGRRANVAFKPVFFVPSLTAVRAAAAAFGGVLNSADQEWSFQGCNVCDGLDPEGNVVQFREAN